MIRFIDKEVGQIEKRDIDRDILFAYLLKKDPERGVVLVYDEGAFYGTICFKTIVNSSPDDLLSCCVMDKYVHIPNDANMLNCLHTILALTELPLVPVFNEKGELLYFAEEVVRDVIDCNVILECLEQRQAKFFLKEIYPQVRGVRIHGFNEYALRFYNILHHYNVPTEVAGEKWKIFFPDYLETKLEEFDSAIMNIYAEGNGYFIDLASDIYLSNWSFLTVIGCVNHLHITERYRKKFRNMGINILTMRFPLRLSDYTLEEEYRRIAGITPMMVGGGITQTTGVAKTQCMKVNGYEVTYEQWKQEKSKNNDFIYINGKAVSIMSFGTYRNKIYIIGPCIVGGTMVMKREESLGACLYRNIQEMGQTYSVVCIMIPQTEFMTYEDLFEYLTITENDIVLVIDNSAEVDIVPYTNDIQLKPIFAKRNGDWFYNMPIHTNYEGNRNIADVLFRQYFMPLMEKAKTYPEYLQMGKRFLSENEEKEINVYLQKIKMPELTRENHIGAIVMNCNPMTKGHLYLVDQARRMVDYLYIFIVEEDKSEFSFRDRYEMVRSEIGHMDNVIVAPSGEFVLSAMTLPLYFEKEEKKEARLDAGKDLHIFGRYIAPSLGITERFVGEENIDLVTKQYNEQMKKILPNYGINVTVIPRLRIEGITVSASIVRELLKKDKWEEARMYLPDKVFSYLRGL